MCIAILVNIIDTTKFKLEQHHQQQQQQQQQSIIGPSVGFT